MADGTRKAISEVEVGDYVLAEDPESGERGPRQVTHLWEHEDTVVDLEIAGDLVTTTEDHPFWNATDSGWQEARQLDEGDLVLGADGTLLEVEGLVAGSSRWGAAYNLTVDGIHTYYIGVGDDTAMVHNTCPLQGPPNPSGRQGDSASQGMPPIRPGAAGGPQTHSPSIIRPAGAGGVDR